MCTRHCYGSIRMKGRVSVGSPRATVSHSCLVSLRARILCQVFLCHKLRTSQILLGCHNHAVPSE